MIKMCYFVIFTDLSFVNNYFNVLLKKKKKKAVSIEVHYR